MPDGKDAPDEDLGRRAGSAFSRKFGLSKCLR
jgi:hypothetical protein